MRTSSTISIYGANGIVKVTVPITAASRRRWRLMEEDSITLSFNLVDSMDFAIGDYIVDEIFGRFTLSEEPVPADYNPTSGAYKYDLRFDADWIYWKNYILMFTSNGVRKETTWVLTDTLDNHLYMVLQNLQAIGYTGYSKVVDSTVEDPGRAVCLTYSGTSILDALKALAEAYKCEFWVDNSVIHFGKCETGTEETLSMTDGTINVENMVPTRNDSEYGNRFYVYGSTKNIPETYRKHLTFKADTFSRIGGYNAFKDSIRAIYPDMLNRSIVQAPTTVTETYAGGWQQFSYEEDTYEDGSHQEYTYTSVVYTSQKISVIQGWGLSIDMDAGYAFAHLKYELLDQSGNVLASGEVPNEGQTVTYTATSGVDSVTIRYSFEYKTYTSGGAPFTPPDAPDVEVAKNTEYAYFVSVTYSGGSFLVRLEDGFLRVVGSRTGAVTYTNPPSGFSTDTEFSFATTGDDAIKVGKVPVSYYTDDDDTIDSIRLVGERRLMLPRSPYPDLDTDIIPHIQNGYVQRAELSRDEVVERVVFFDEIYPRCALRVTSVEESEYANDTTYSDGSKKIANLPAYILQARRIVKNGANQDFPFDPDTMMVVGKLTATFLTPDEAKNYSGSSSEQASLLMGMTFDVACNRSNGVTTYQLAWNSDYGEKLPNEVLRPKVGDAFILAGWNPAMMSTLGLIKDAENELAKTADHYAELLEEAQFTFECHMMSDWVLGRCTMQGGHALPDGLFPMGQKVVVHHNALKADKHTRVIGFEYKLDIPYDTPSYTVGESDAYSKLREIEKSLHAQSSVSATNNTTSVNISGGGSSDGESTGGGKTLHLVPGTMAGMSSVDYNGSEEKTFRVPSVVDHLVDGNIIPRIANDGQGGSILVDKDGNEVAGKQFFELVVDSTTVNEETGETEYTYSVKLKEEYVGLWAEGWIAAGGVGAGIGGGGGSSTLSGLLDVYGISDYVLHPDGTQVANGDALRYDSNLGKWVALSVSEDAGGVALSLSTSAAFLLDANGNFILDSSGGGNGEFLATTNVGINIDLLDSGGNVLSSVSLPSVSASNYLSSYVPTSRTINGHPLTSDITLSAVNDLGVAQWAMGGVGSTIPFSILPELYTLGTRVAATVAKGTMLGINAISNDLSSTGSESSLIKWENGAWHFYGNLYADGWIAAGGVGAGGSGGGGGSSTLSGLLDVYGNAGNVLRPDGQAAVPGDSLVYNNSLGKWVAGVVLSGGMYLSLTRTSTNMLEFVGEFLQDSAGNFIVTTDIGADINLLDKDGVLLSSISIPTTNISALLSNYLTSSDLANWHGSANITTLGTVSTGTWNATPIGVTKGGTGLISIPKGAILYGSAANVIGTISANGTATKKFLTQASENAPAWSVIEFSDIPALYIGKTPVKGNNTSNDTLIGINGFTTKATASDNDDNSLFVWEENTGAWHLKGNFYADGWIASGGVGSSGGGSSAVFITDLEDVQNGTPNQGDLLVYNSNAREWQFTAQSQIVPTITATTSGTGNALTGVSVSGATLTFTKGTFLTTHQTVTLAPGTNNGTLKLTTDAGTTDNIAVKGLGSLAYKSSLVASDIPSLDASKITSGTLGVDRIPNLSASKITSGTLGVDRIPALPASKITSGTLDIARIPNLSSIYLPLSGGTMTGWITFTYGNGIVSNDSTGTGHSLRSYVGADDDFAHYDGTNWRRIWDAGNSNLSTVDWAAKDIVASGTIRSGGNIYDKGSIFDLNRDGGNGTLGDANRMGLEIESYSSFGGIRFKTYNSSGLVRADNLVFSNSGNVGIGTTHPLYLLDVNGASHATSLRIGENASSATHDYQNTYLVWDDANNAWHLVGNFYADGWIAAGGIGSGGGQGGGTLEGCNDVQISSPHTSGDLLRYNGTKWVNVPQTEIVPTITVTPSGTGNAVTALSYSNGVITYTKGSTFLTSSDLDGYVNAISTGSGNYITGVSKSGKTLTFTYGTLPTTIALSNVTGADDLKLIEALTGGGLLRRNGTNNTWSLDTTAYTTNTGTVTSVTIKGGTGISVSSTSAITDSGTRTISINSEYQTDILHGATAYGWGNHANAGYAAASSLSNYIPLAGSTSITGTLGASGWSITKAGAANFASVSVTGGTSSGFLKANGSVDTTSYLSSHQSIYALTLSAGSFTAGTYTPNSAAKSFNIPTTLDHITDGTNRKLSNYVTLSGTQTITGAKTFTTNPVTIGSDSGLSVNASSYIDIGNARLVYDSGANALHITKKSGTSATIGFFADGFVASGGVAGQTTSSYVDFESNQTIGGNKTFTGTTTLGNVTGPISLSGALNGLSIIKDSNNYVSLRASRIDIQDNGNNLFLCRGGGKVFLCANPGGTVSQKLYLDSSSTAIAQAWNTHSDIRLKEDIETVSKAEAIEKVMALNPVRWRWKSGGLSAGLIAQEVEKVLPFMVTDGEYKGLAYQMLHAYEVSAIQSHEERIRQLERENEYLRSEIRALKS